MRPARLTPAPISVSPPPPDASTVLRTRGRAASVDHLMTPVSAAPKSRSGLRVRGESSNCCSLRAAARPSREAACHRRCRHTRPSGAQRSSRRAASLRRDRSAEGFPPPLGYDPTELRRGSPKRLRREGGALQSKRRRSASLSGEREPTSADYTREPAECFSRRAHGRGAFYAEHLPPHSTVRCFVSKSTVGCSSRRAQ